MQKMMVGSASALSSYILLLALMMVFLAKSALAGNVTYDHRSLIIDGQKKLLISASIHYPRSVPAVTNLCNRLARWWSFFAFVLFTDESADVKVYVDWRGEIGLTISVSFHWRVTSLGGWKLMVGSLVWDGVWVSNVLFINFRCGQAL